MKFTMPALFRCLCQPLDRRQMPRSHFEMPDVPIRRGLWWQLNIKVIKIDEKMLMLSWVLFPSTNQSVTKRWKSERPHRPRHHKDHKTEKNAEFIIQTKRFRIRKEKWVETIDIVKEMIQRRALLFEVLLTHPGVQALAAHRLSSSWRWLKLLACTAVLALLTQIGSIQVLR